jgi:menaquinone-dependent protoporphyrinogen oxidase
MQHNVLVTYGSRHGSTKEIAERIASTMASEEIRTTVLPVESVRDADGFDGYVIGSAVYAMHWLGPAKSFIHRHREVLRRHPVWLFSSGPLSDEPSELAAATPRDVADLEHEIDARGHQVFAGAWDRDAPAIGFLESVMRVIPAARDALPAADHRDWTAIDAYARAVAGELEVALDPE